jgi:hypothetical protein
LRDLIDMILIRDMLDRDDLAAVRRVCIETFEVRTMHTCPMRIASGRLVRPFVAPQRSACRGREQLLDQPLVVASPRDGMNAASADSPTAAS